MSLKIEPLPIGMALILGFALGSPAMGLGFDFNNASIPVEEIQDGGVPVDGVPALTNPDWISAEEGDNYLDPEDWVIGFIQGKTVRAYPFRILNWHEVVNETVEGKPLVVSYCPLTGTARIFSAESAGKRLLFGVSGKLYKDNLLFYDRETKSLWSQMKGEAVSGPMKGSVLKPLPILVTSWAAWKSQYPDTRVLSLDTGYLRNYSKDPYEDYLRSARPMFPIGPVRTELPSKEWVLGVRLHEKTKAYPLRTLTQLPPSVFEDTLGEEKVSLEWLPQLAELRVLDSRGNLIPTVRCYWFAWQAFYPNTEVFKKKNA